MKRWLALFLAALMLLPLCACGGQKDVCKEARTCWRTVGSDEISLERVYVIQYTSRLHLTGDVLDNPMYQEIPERGTAILFHAHRTKNPFHDSYACFLDERGKLVFTFDYEENYKLYEKHYENFSRYNVAAGEKAVEYLENCNYIAGMINDADGEPLGGKMAKNTWYELSDQQREWVEK